MKRYSYPVRSNFKPRSLRTREKRTKRRLIRNIILGILLIYIVLAWGLPNLVRGLSLLNRFKSNPSPSSATEDISLAPPVLNIPFEATNSAALRITGYASPKSKVQIYFDDTIKTIADTKEDGSFQTEPLTLVLGTNNIYGKVVDENNHSSLPSKTIKLIYSSDKPKLDVSSPADNTQIKGGDKKVGVSGTTDPDDSVAVNGQTAIVDSSGNFSITIPIQDGDNTVVVVATNTFGNITQIQRKVNYSQ